jgi:hypothetical protein
LNRNRRDQFVKPDDIEEAQDCKPSQPACISYTIHLQSPMTFYGRAMR